jgi:hypothetical protein
MRGEATAPSRMPGSRKRASDWDRWSAATSVDPSQRGSLREVSSDARISLAEGMPQSLEVNVAVSSDLIVDAGLAERVVELFPRRAGADRMNRSGVNIAVTSHLVLFALPLAFEPRRS